MIAIKKFGFIAAAIALCISTSAQTYIEKLNRGVVAVPLEKKGRSSSAGSPFSGENFVSWRCLTTDDKDATFDILRDGKVIASGLKGATCYTDTKGDAKSSYSVVTHQKGTSETSAPVTAWSQPYMSLSLDKPADGKTPDGKTCSYTPNDCSCGDVDGDGEYEIILKWDPSNAHDNAHDGYTGNVLLDCYKLNGEKLWRIDLGKNIRAGAHYTQFLVYDFDGDGKAELVCKTAPGSIDGKGNFVTAAATDADILKADNSANYVEKNGRILSGPEYLTIFSGLDGHAINTIYYNPNRAFGVGGSANYDVDGWGDTDHVHGNRGERYLAGVAFLAGKDHNPSAVMCRGYYTRAYLWAVDFDGKQLHTRWLHSSVSPSEWKAVDGNGNVIREATGLEHATYGQGAHSLSIGDVDGDGCDEIEYGSAAVDNDGTLLYSTGLGHGDAQHLGDFDPQRPGLEYFMVHEAPPYGCDLRDAKTGEILFRETDNDDTGRGLCADIDSLHPGSEFWCSAKKAVYDIKGNIIAETEKWTPQNFRIYWDGDLYDELIGNGRMGNRPGSPDMMPRGQRPSRDGKRPPMPQDGQQPPRDGQRPPMGQNGQRPPRDGQRPPMPQNGHMPPMGQHNGPMPRPDYYVAKWNGTGCDQLKVNGKILSEWGNSASCNGTKATPCLQADLFGDWREEIVLYDASDNAHLNIFSTNIPTQYRIPTLMHNHQYRMSIAWQNVAYNQPPHVSELKVIK